VPYIQELCSTLRDNQKRSCKYMVAIASLFVYCCNWKPVPVLHTILIIIAGNQSPSQNEGDSNTAIKRIFSLKIFFIYSLL
jgi:hypothetical protein